MVYSIEMGVPEMDALWKDLLGKADSGELDGNERELLKKLQKALLLLSINPRHPGLRTHEIVSLSVRFGQKVLQSYLENRRAGARRLFWSFGPENGVITILGIERHPESGKSPGYDRVRLSAMRRADEV